MRRTTAAVLLAATTLTLAGCSSGPTEAEKEKTCVAAIQARPDGDDSEPKECKFLSDDDYQLLLMSKAIKDSSLAPFLQDQ